MKDYVVNGRVVDITLENGKVVKASTAFLENMMKNLDIDMDEAVFTWLEDEEYLINEEQAELTKQAKENKSIKIIGAKAEKKVAAKKTQKERVIKENPTKEMIISAIAELLPNFAQNIVVENKGKLITFTVGEDEFKLDLTQKRKPKQK